MKITIFQESFNKALTAVSKIVTSRAQLPILTNLLISCKNGKIKISATNLETGINYWLAAKIEQEGEITIPAKQITEFVNSLPADKVVLETENEKLKIQCRNYKGILNGISATEFPHLSCVAEEKKGNQEISFLTEKFIEAINQVAFAAAQDESRPILTGMKIIFQKNKTLLVATDGYRLSIKKINMNEETNIGQLIIPAKTLTEVIRLVSIKEKEDKINVLLLKKNNQIIFYQDQIEILARLLEGEFPDFEKIIPQEQNQKVIINKEEFERAIKTAAVFSRDSANIVKFIISGKNIKISANAPEIGENEVELTSLTELNEEIKIAFNCRFIQDFLSVIKSENIEINLSESLKPGVFKGEKEDSFLHLIMPVRLQD